MRGQPAPPPQGPFSPNMSDQNFVIAILFKIAERSSIENSEINITPQSLGGSVARYILGWVRFYVRDGRINIRGGSFDWKLKFQFTYFRVVKSDWRAYTPNLSNQNFEIAILFEIVQRSDDKTPGSIYTPTHPKKRGKGFNSYPGGI